MLNIEKLFNKSFSAIRTQPKILLPLTLNWIPEAVIPLASSLIAGGIKYYNTDELRPAFNTDPLRLTLTLLKNNSGETGLIMLAILLSILIIPFVNAIYPSISYQIFYRKKIHLTSAVFTAKQRYLKVLWTSAIFCTLSALAISATIILAALLPAVAASLGVIQAELSGTLSAIAALILLMVLIIHILPMWIVLGPTVVIENLSGLQAMEKSYRTVKGKLKEVWTFIILLTVANGLYFWLVALIAGSVEFALGGYRTIAEMILMLLPSAFVLLSNGLLYLEISSASPNPPVSRPAAARPQKKVKRQNIPRHHN